MISKELRSRVRDALRHTNEPYALDELQDEELVQVWYAMPTTRECESPNRNDCKGPLVVYYWHGSGKGASERCLAHAGSDIVRCFSEPAREYEAFVDALRRWIANDPNARIMGRGMPSAGEKLQAGSARCWEPGWKGFHNTSGVLDPSCPATQPYYTHHRDTSLTVPVRGRYPTPTNQETDMPFGQKMGSMKALKQSLQKGASGAAWIKYIPRDGSMNVRFIQEPDEWVNYVEHYDQTLRKSFPCSDEADCPGCLSGERKSYRYLANAVDRDSDRVIPLQLPKDLANRLVVKYEKWGSLIDRDIELTRSGTGLDTVYDLDAGPKDHLKIDKYSPLDLIKVLEDAFASVFGGSQAADDDDEDDTTLGTPSAAIKPKKQSRAAKVLEQTESGAPQFAEDDDEGEDEDEAPATGFADDPTVFDADPTGGDLDSAGDGPEVDDDEGEGYTEEDLKAMPLGVLRAVARNDFQIDTKGKGQKEIIAAIMATAGEDD